MKIRGLLILLTLVLCFGSVSWAGDLILMTEIFPPYQYKDDVDNKLIGITTEVVEAIQKKVGDTSKVKVYPWTRGLKILETKKNSALFSMLRTDEREELYKWVGPIAKMEMVFFKKKGSPIELASTDDARKVGKIGVTKGVGNHGVLVAQGFTNLDVISSGIDEKNIKKLVKGRIDLWPSLVGPGLYNAKRMGFDGEIVPVGVPLFKGDFYIAFNKQTDDAIINQWQKALDELIADGTVDAIKNRY